MTDRETRRAADALSWRIRNRGDDDPEIVAAEFMTVLRQRGWRHVPTLTPAVDESRPPTPPPAEWRQARAALTRRPEWTN